MANIWGLRMVLHGVMMLALASLNHGQEADPCTVQTGDSQVILNLVESQGDQVDQLTSPVELPITGVPGTDIELEILPPDRREDRQFFKLSGKQVQLLEPLDRDQSDLSSLMFQLTCIDLQTRRRKTIPVVVTISDINDNPPVFQGNPYVITIPESTPINSIVFAGLKATDPDSNVNGQVEFHVVPGDGTPQDGFGIFEIDLPHQGLVKLAKKLDYEDVKTYYLNIQASDRAVDPEGRFTANTVLTINILDSDDLNPKFSESTYTARVTSGIVGGPLHVSPEKIRAEDQDTLRTAVKYSFADGSPASFHDVFTIDEDTGVVKQIQSADKSTVKLFDIVVKAEEQSDDKKFATARLLVQVHAEDVNPPVLVATSRVGFVPENSKIGTRVTDQRGQEIKFVVTDADHIGADDPAAKYDFEMTTNFFTVDEEGYLVVNDENLDRDPPNEDKLNFQIYAREADGARNTSAPLSMTINIQDVNDNAPSLASIRDVVLAAGTSRRVIAKLNATDNDLDKDLRFRLLKVTNNGKNKFAVNSRTGDVEVMAPVKTGERFSLSVAVVDKGGLSSEGVLEVRVNSGPNLRGPAFDQFLYEAKVSEGAPKFASVVTAQAKDPEGDPVRYSIIEGNDAGHFQIEESTGIIRAMHPLDRETLRRYSLVVRAEDPGGKFGTATVNIVVTDINDQNPFFVDLPYSFRVKEGETGASVGRVRAEDHDIGDNALIYYSVPDDSLFSIDAISGEIRTNADLDFERHSVHYLVVSANDGGKQSRIATATVTVLVQDTADEVPRFPTQVYEASVPENVKDYLVTTVMAEDLDSEPSVTYRLVQGDLDKFKIHPKSGVIRTTRGLDFERQSTFTLIVGTEESRLSGLDNLPGVTAEVQIKVEDRNDIPPMFTRSPRGNLIDVRNDARIGTIIGTVAATDADGTTPGNEVRYEITADGSSEKAVLYFGIDNERGDIRVRDDLTQELFDEYRLQIRAYDLGEPSLDSTIMVRVRVKQVITLSPEEGVGFIETSQFVEVPENLAEEALIKTLALSPRSDKAKGLKILCDVVSVRNHQDQEIPGMFYGRLNEEGHCDLIHGKGNLDRESDPNFKVEIKLNTLSAYANPKKMTAKVNVVLLDENDNAPQFIYNEDISRVVKDQYIVAIHDTLPINDLVFKVKAFDKDSGENSRLEYELRGDNIAQDYFAINSETGEVTNIDTFIGVSQEDLPFELIILVRDNPNDHSLSKTQQTILVVNLLRPGDGIVLTIADTPPNVMSQKKGELMELLQQNTNLLVTIDKMMPAMGKYGNGSCCKPLPRSTDVYFHVVDPNTNEILPFDHEKVQRSISSKQAASNLKYAIAGHLGVQAADVHEPYVSTYESASNASPIRTAGSTYEGFPTLLIIFGCLVFALAFVAICYLCFIKRKMITNEEKQTKMIVIPRYEPVFVEPSHKQYETQVLQMSVPIDDNDQIRSGPQVGSDSSFNLDSISYITKDRFSSMGDQSPMHSDSTEATRLSPGVGNQSGHYATVDGDEDRVTPIRNPLFGRSDDDEGLRRLSASTTNANVLFGEPRREFASSTPKRQSSSQELEETRPRGTTQL
ncbi:cadherin-99C-like isoform X2 [Tigriopus californicus]|uniref:cadherin-99C-like isoform X2 n=1 Tax=Tigriopus californicus TaxID=6832 RepID=UPI0027D9EF60|nr:cadherin-99C-like isoform X2 [Tigriopus californicus]